MQVLHRKSYTRVAKYSSYNPILIPSLKSTPMRIPPQHPIPRQMRSRAPSGYIQREYSIPPSIPQTTSRRAPHSKKSHQRNPEMFRVHTHNHECMQPTCINASIQTARVQRAKLHGCNEPNRTRAWSQTAHVQQANMQRVSSKPPSSRRLR